MWYDSALIIGAYLLGSAPHLLALGKLRGVHLEGDWHINLWRKGGRLIGLIGVLIEFVKGAIPILVGKTLGFSLLTITIAGLAVVIGQMWPIFSKFDGEKGNTTGLAMAAALTPIPLLFTLIPIATGAALRTWPILLNTTQSLNERLKFRGPPSRSLPLGMAAGFFILPIISWQLGESLIVTSGFSALFILIMVRRLTAGLKDDLKASNDTKGIYINRLLYDRSYCQQQEIDLHGE